jgi:hypothetical protein
MSVGELLVSSENGPLIALGMTGASFDSAQRAGVVRIEANTDAMEFIAAHVGYTKHVERLSSLVLITRQSGEQREMISRWDDRLPVHQGTPNTGRFFLANHLDRDMPASANREMFVQVARRIGAPALTEISIPSWAEGEDRSYAGDFATGLLMGQRPLDLPPKPSFGKAMRNFFTDESALLATIKRIRADDTMPNPFIITRQPGRPEIEERRQLER